MFIKLQTLWLRGGVRVEIKDHHLCITEGGRLHLIHLTPSGEVLRVTSMDAETELTSVSGSANV